MVLTRRWRKSRVVRLRGLGPSQCSQSQEGGSWMRGETANSRLGQLRAR